MRVLITGGAGFLGSHLADALVRRGDEVVVLDNYRRGRPENLRDVRDRVSLVQGDVRDEADLAQCLPGTEVVFHLAAQSNVMGSLEDLDYSFSSNVTGTFNVLQACVANGVRRIVFASSREVYGDPASLPVREDAPLAPKNPYGASKVAGEAYCKAWQRSYGIECQVLRFANLFGPRDRDRVIPLWLERAALGEDLQLYGGDQVLDFLWVGQAVDGLMAAARCELDGPVNVGSGRGIRLGDLAARILGLRPTTSRLSVQGSRSVEVSRFVADTTRMRQVLGVVANPDSLDVHLSEMDSLRAGARYSASGKVG